MENSVASLVRRMETDFKSGTITRSKYVIDSPKQDLDIISAYLESRHLEGDNDFLTTDKPFYNTCVAKRNITFRATDIDRKNMKVKATKRADFLSAFLGSIHFQEWMKEADFGTFINNSGLIEASHNSVITKHVEKDGDLKSIVVPWDRILCDFINFDANPKVEILWFTPAELMMNDNYDQEAVEGLIEDSKTTRTTIDGQPKDAKADYIPVYEVHGNLSRATYKESKGLEVNDGDEKDFFQQMHAVSFVKKEGKHNDYTLYSGKEKEDPYMLMALLPTVDGSISLDGSVKNNFNSQWMVNDTIIKMKDHLAIALKMFFQTADPNWQGKNNTAVDNGSIFVHTTGNPLTQVNNTPNTTAATAFEQLWEGQGNQNAGISEAMLGQHAPSGTAWRQVQALLQESHDLFQVMRQNKALCYERMLNKYHAPFIMKKMDTTKEIAATLDANQIKFIDSKYIPGEVVKRHNRQIIDEVLGGKIAQQPDDVAIKGEIQGELNELGNQRFIKPSEIKERRWKDVLKGFKFMFECDPTDESKDTQAVMATYDTALKFIIGLQGRQMNPIEEFLFNGLISQTGVLSPVELSNLNAKTPQLPMNPAAPVTGGQQMVGAGNMQLKPM